MAIGTTTKRALSGWITRGVAALLVIVVLRAMGCSHHELPTAAGGNAANGDASAVDRSDPSGLCQGDLDVYDVARNEWMKHVFGFGAALEALDFDVAEWHLNREDDAWDRFLDAQSNADRACVGNLLLATVNGESIREERRTHNGVRATCQELEFLDC